MLIMSLVIGGKMKVFGVGNGQVTTPVTSQGITFDTKIPKDDREKEVVLATVIGSALIFWLLLQVSCSSYRLFYGSLHHTIFV